MKKNILDQWKYLSQREQRLGIVGGIVLALLLFYFIIYNPLSNSVDQYQQQIKNNAELLSWMKTAREQIKRAATAPAKNGVTGSILVQTEDSIKKKQLESLVSEIKQTQNDQVQVRFAAISFESLLPWLQALTEQYSLNIFKIILKRSDEEGIVAATVVVSS